MKKILISMMISLVLITASCITSRDVRYRSEEKRDGDGVVIKRQKRVVTDDGKGVTIKVSKESRNDRRKERIERRRHRDNNEPVIIIDKNR
jgi:hypothetical protein